MSKNTGGPAFPQVELDRVTGNPCDQHFGMTLRDYFAAKAMQALIYRPESEYWTTEEIAIDAYSYADEMLKEREQ